MHRAEPIVRQQCAAIMNCSGKLTTLPMYLRTRSGYSFTASLMEQKMTPACVREQEDWGVVNEHERAAVTAMLEHHQHT